MTKSVREAMTTNPRAIGTTDSVVEAARVMRDEHVGSLPVVEDGRLAGMITDRDIAIRIVAEGADPESVKVGEIASRRLVTAEPDQDLDEARRLMAEHQVRRLPVVEGDELVGILAQADVTREEDPEQVGEMLEAISEPSKSERHV
jgi:CBS domain-containing protein